MSNREHQAGRELVKVFLQNARSSLLADAESGSALVIEHLAVVEGFIEKGQFELALNCLAEAGHKTTPRAKFWDSLSKAAGDLGLSEKARDFQFLWVVTASLSLEREVNRR